MSKNLPVAVGYAVAPAVGLPASLVVGAAVFADGAAIISAERLVPVIATYVTLAFVLSFVGSLVWSPAIWWRWGVLSGIPGFAVVGLLGRDIGPAFQLLYVAVTLASASVGGLLGKLAATLLRDG